MRPFLPFQAVKYLEGMLIQSHQAQRKQKKLAAEMDDLKLNEAGGGDEKTEAPTKSSAPKESMEAGAGEEAKAAEPQVKEEIIDDDQDKAEATSAESEKLSKSGGENDDGGTAAEVEDNGEDGEEEEEDEIKIDPKTYCKLGHFHLLLEDYAKGECKVDKCSWNNN